MFLGASVVACALGGQPTQATQPLWIFFRDKPTAQAGDVRAERTPLTERALARRALRRSAPGLVDERDLPVDPTYVATVEMLGGHVRVESRWLNAISVEIDPRHLRVLAALPFVVALQPVRSATMPNDATEAPLAGGGVAGLDYGAAYGQTAQIDLLGLHARGFHGEGMVIGILDTGFHRGHEALLGAAHPLVVLAEYDFINDDGNTDIESDDDPDQHKHGTYILGTLASYLPGQIIGTAFGASYVLAKTEDATSETPIEEDYYVAGLEFIEANGADVATSSLGYFDWYLADDFDGLTAVTTIAVNAATENGLVCCTAGGNGYHDDDPSTLHLGAPADAFDVLSCGAVDSEGVIADFSSDGPTADGRVKPEVLALGVATTTIRATEETGLYAASGTSLATPLVAGAAACILQARPDFGVSELRAALFATATDYAATGTTDRLFIRGYGILQADAAASHGRALGDLDLDGHVNGADLAALLGGWGSCGDCAACPADLDGDCAADAADLSILLGAWS